MTTRHCSRCECDLTRPHAEHCNYVRATDFEEAASRKTYHALIHTPETRARVERVADATGRDFTELSAEMARPKAKQTIRIPKGQEMTEQGNTLIQTHAFEELEFSIPLGEFETERVESPSAQDRDEVAYVYEAEDETPVVKTGLVCPDCTTSDDEILWGVNA